MGQVAFNYEQWVTRFPEFSSVTQETAAAYFDDASDFLRNSPYWSPIRDDARKLRLLNLLTAHVAELSRRVGRGNHLVGRINSATEGGVSVQAEFDASAANAYFAQTPYGAQFWEATRAYRTMHYRPGLTVSPFPPFWRRGWTDGWDGSEGF